MDIVSRVKNILVTPNTEWPVIAGEPANTAGLYSNYIVPLAGIGLVATIVGEALAGNIGQGVGLAVVQFILSLIIVFVDGIIFSKVAPMFGGRDDFGQGLKLAAYSNTPGWVVAVINIVTPIIPALGILGLLAFYGLYLLYAGSVPVMGVPKEKAVVFTIVAIVIAIVIYLLISILIGGVIFAAMIHH